MSYFLGNFIPYLSWNPLSCGRYAFVNNGKLNNHYTIRDLLSRNTQHRILMINAFQYHSVISNTFNLSTPPYSYSSILFIKPAAQDRLSFKTENLQLARWLRPVTWFQLSLFRQSKYNVAGLLPFTFSRGILTIAENNGKTITSFVL